MRIYLSGPVTGSDDYFKRFMDAENDLVATIPGAEVVNPVAECAKAGMAEDTHTWEQFMDYCLWLMGGCTHIKMLDGWRVSRGACVEYYMAKAMGLGLV